MKACALACVSIREEISQYGCFTAGGDSTPALESYVLDEDYLICSNSMETALKISP